MPTVTFSLKGPAMPTMKFYMTPGSCSTGIHIILEELEESFECHIVNLPAGDHFKPSYVAINPKATIPTLVTREGAVLTEVPAIAYWLGRTHPRRGLWPSDPMQETRAIEAMAYAVNVVHGQGFARIFATGTFSSNPADHPVIECRGRDIVAMGFEILNTALPEENYLLGEYSVADPILFYLEFWADKIGIPIPARLLGHYRRMLARPVVERVLREEGYSPPTLGCYNQNGDRSQ
jgi:glutathione S-transferase